MSEREVVSLDPATAADATLLSNLLELYIHDLSDVFDVELGSDGRYGYDRLSTYWAEPERRFPFIIRCGGRIAGFVLAKRGSSASSDANVLDVAEFFVMRRFRRLGVGREAAFLLWGRMAGRWTVRVADNNTRALAFWRTVIGQYTGGMVSTPERHSDRGDWWVFRFDSSAARAGRV